MILRPKDPRKKKNWGINRSVDLVQIGGKVEVKDKLPAQISNVKDGESREVVFNTKNLQTDFENSFIESVVGSSIRMQQSPTRGALKDEVKPKQKIKSVLPPLKNKEFAKMIKTDYGSFEMFDGLRTQMFPSQFQESYSQLINEKKGLGSKKSSL